MSLNITFQGKIFNNVGTQYGSNDVRYHAYFYKLNSGSSVSTWNNLRLSELGYFSINLGDGDWLGQNSTANSGDKVLILFWTPNTSLQSDTDLIEWGLVEIELDGRPVYIQNVQIKEPFNPNCLFNQTGILNTNEDITITDIGSNDNHTWVYEAASHYQTPSMYGQNMFELNRLNSGCVEIDWDEIVDSGLDSGTSYNHQYTTIGDYNIQVILTNQSGLTCSTPFLIRIKYRPPVVDFLIDNDTPNPIADSGVGQIVNFINDSTDPDTRAVIDNWTTDWIFNDDGIYGNYDVSHLAQIFNLEPTFQWHNPEVHDVTLKVNWFDGFDWLVEETTKQINQNVWTVTNGLTWDEPVIEDLPITFTPDIGGSSGVEPSVDYEVNSINVLTGLSPAESWDWVFDFSDTHQVGQIINYHDGFSTQTNIEYFDVEMHPVSSFGWEPYGCGKKFFSTSSPGKPPIVEYKWSVYSEEELVDVGPNKSDFYYAWPYPGTFDIKLEIVDSKSDTNISNEMFTDVECPTAVAVGGGGGVRTREIIKPSPIVKVRLRHKEDHEDEVFQESSIRVKLKCETIELIQEI